MNCIRAVRDPRTKMARVVQLLLNLPAFMFAVWVMYWSLPLGTLCLFLKTWKLLGARNDAYQWCVSAAPSSQDHRAVAKCTQFSALLARRCNFLVTVFFIRVRKYGSNDVYRDGPCMFLVSNCSAGAQQQGQG